MTDRRAAVSVVFLAMLMALVALGVDLLLPAFDDVRSAFDMPSDSTQPARLITVYFLGLALPQIVWGPLADRFGRKPVMYTAFALYGIGTIGAALAPTFGILLVARFVWGVGAAGARVIVIAIIRDLHEGDEMARFLSVVMAIFLLVPVFAPGLGVATLAILPWRSLFWLTFGLLVLLWLWALRIPETLAAEHVLPLDIGSVGRAIRVVVTTPVTAAYTAATMFMQGAFASYLASSELVIDEIFGRGHQFAWIFGIVAVALGVASLGVARLVTRIGGATLIRRGFIASTVVSALLFAVAVTAGGRPGFWVFFPLLTVQLTFHVGLMPTLNSLALVPLGAVAGTAASVTGALRVAAGGVIGALIDPHVDNSVTPWAIGFMAGSVASLVAVHLVQAPTPTAAPER